MIILVVDLFVVQYFFYALMDIKKNNINEDNPSHPTGIKVPYVCLMVNAAKHVYSDMHKRGEKFGVNQTRCTSFERNLWCQSDRMLDYTL